MNGYMKTTSLSSHYGRKLPTKGAFWGTIEAADSRFHFIRDLANASKHVRLTRGPSTSMTHVANTSIQVAGFQSDAFDTSAFQTGGVKMKDGKADVSFDVAARALFGMWTQLLAAMP
jgi:hypothetical protein